MESLLENILVGATLKFHTVGRNIIQPPSIFLCSSSHPFVPASLVKNTSVVAPNLSEFLQFSLLQPRSHQRVAGVQMTEPGLSSAHQNHLKRCSKTQITSSTAEGLMEASGTT